MDEKKRGELTREVFGGRAKKLSPNEPEGVSGGVIEENQIEELKSRLALIKANGISQAVCPNVTLDDVREFIRTYFASV